VLIQQGGLTQDEVQHIDSEIAQAVEEAVRYAEESPEPDVAVTLEDIYA